MRIWLVCVVALFGAVQLYDWVQQMTVPLPVYGVAGLLLAVVSNFDKLPRLQTAQEPTTAAAIAPDATEPQPPAPGPILSDFSAKQSSLQSGRVAKPQLPNLTPSAPSISFEIRQSKS
jgi:hypothetical protein